MNNIGKKIQEVRNERGWSQKELAENSGVLLTTLSKIEAGQIQNPTIKKVAKIAEALEIKIDELVY